MVISFATNVSVSAYTRLPIKSIDLTRVDEFAGGDTLVYPRSTIMNGTLYLLSLNGKQYPLKAGDFIRFSLRDGAIETLAMLSDRLALQIQGHVVSIETGSGKDRVNLMPSILEWLLARQPLSLLWGSTAFLFGLVATIARWWRSQI